MSTRRRSRSSTIIAICRRRTSPRTGSFANLFEIWLEGDHYKWRAMRANGVDERFCTGDAAPYEKFLAWARTVPNTLRNPLYHWTHLELKRYFGIDELLDESSAQRIWDRANELLKTDELRAHEHPRKIPCQRRLHHRRSDRRPGQPQGAGCLRPDHQGVPRLPAG